MTYWDLFIPLALVMLGFITAFFLGLLVGAFWFEIEEQP